MKDLHLTLSDYQKLKEIGHGTDGKVLRYNFNTLVKAYHESMYYIENRDRILSLEDKVFDKDSFKIHNKKNTTNYFLNDEDGLLRIPSEFAIEKAIELNSTVKRTDLPIGKLYVDNRFVGCVLKKEHGIQLHKLSGLPVEIKKKILINLLSDIEELLLNNIYHIDLNNSPYITNVTFNYANQSQIKEQGHSHILVNPFTLKTNLIDLDGKSTIYTEKRNYKFERRVLQDLCTLIMEFLYNIDNYSELEYDELIEQITSNGFRLDDISPIINGDIMYCDDLRLLLKKD